MSSRLTDGRARSVTRRKQSGGGGTKLEAPTHSTLSRDVGAAAFNVLVIATVSAGKSTLINALVGRELLHAANEATTACVAAIENRPYQRHFRGWCFTTSGRELASQDKISSHQVRAWNSNAQVTHIRLAGPFRSPKGVTARLVLHDTPGTNNGLDLSHETRALEALGRTSAQFVLCVLDIGQLTTDDNRSLLTKLRSGLDVRASLPIAFVLNKADLLDDQNGEELGAYVSQARTFLEAQGFNSPLIVPTMAAAALYAHMAINEEPLTRAQQARLRLGQRTVEADEQKLISTALIPEAVRQQVLKDLADLDGARLKPLLEDASVFEHEWRRLITLSGIRTLEHLIKYQRNTCVKP